MKRGIIPSVRAEYMREYQEKHKERLSEKRRRKFVCLCGVEYTYPNRCRHIRSNKHQRWVDNNNEIQ